MKKNYVNILPTPAIRFLVYWRLFHRSISNIIFNFPHGKKFRNAVLHTGNYNQGQFPASKVMFCRDKMKGWGLSYS
jgi:hypothetical protein